MKTTATKTICFRRPRLFFLSDRCGFILSKRGLRILSFLFSFYSTAAFAQPGNNGCGGAFPLTSAAECAGGRIDDGLRNGGAATGSGTLGSVGCTVGATNPVDVWYTYTATTTTPTIYLRNMGTEMNNSPRIQIYNTTSCTAGTLNANQIGCAGADNIAELALTPTVSLTIGSTYLIRVFTNNNSVAAGSVADWQYDICVANPPANDLCANASPLTSNPFCSLTAGTLTGATSVTLASPGCGPATIRDVWYSFVAQSVSPTISISTAPTNARVQLFQGGCGALSSIGCSAGTSYAATGLTIGSTYWVRVYSTTNASGTFNICVTDPAPFNNNKCATGDILISGTSCVNTIGTMYASTLTTTGFSVSGYNCATTPGPAPTYDVWYRFVAQTINPTITLSGLGSELGTVGMQLLTAGNCTNAMTSLFCGSTSIAANHLTVGSTYWVRIYTTGAAITNYNNGRFDICVTDPVMNRPFNDSCTYAINLPISGNCENIRGTIARAGLEPYTITGDCAVTPAPTYDVWYRFTAISNLTEINLTGLAANFPSARFQVLAGSCNSLTSLVCGIANTTSSLATTTGTTYYVRVYATDAGPSPNGLGTFNLCVRALNVPIVRYGNSYVNITKKAVGGVVEPGDVLEIRMTINQKDAGGTLFHPRFVDNLPSNTTLLTSHPISIITNEGLTYKSYSTANDADAGRYNASPLPTEYNIRLNVGLGSLIEPGNPVNTTAANDINTTGQIIPNANRPRGGGGVLFAVAYRVTVTGALGQVVKVNPGRFIYATMAGGTDVTLASADTIRIRISANETLCANSTGLNNAVEQGGTFGSGATLARQTDLTTPIAGYAYLPNPSGSVEIGDGRYSIVKNVSPRSSTFQTPRQQPNCDIAPALAWTDPMNCNNRMFGHWVVDGDHTGTNTAAGNLPPAANTNGGYMLLVNADYVASEAYRQTISNLCPNTYYEFSAWIRNVCSTCGTDSAGQQFTNSADPARHPGVVGVYPNLSFTVDGLDYYSTGEVDVTGWEKRGFVFLTGPSQTNATFTIRNNSQGGGGNDWAMDDISVSTCLPTMRYSPQGMDSLCQNNLYVIGDTIRSRYNTYTNYRWQRMRAAESTWTDLTGDMVASQYVNGNGEFEFVTNWTLPPSETQLANSGDLYRVIVSTTTSNLSNEACRFSDNAGIYHLRIMDCYDALSVNLTSFSGRLNNGQPVLAWTTDKESRPVSFKLEKSYDGTRFFTVTSIDGRQHPSDAVNRYSHKDSVLKGKAFYRVTLIAEGGREVKSRVITLQADVTSFVLQNLGNPFDDEISFDVLSSASGPLQLLLVDGNGKRVRSKEQTIFAGTNNVVLQDLGSLARGVYILHISLNGQTISRKVVKQ